MNAPTGAAQSDPRTQIAFTVAKKAMDVTREQGEAAIQLVKEAAETAKGPDVENRRGNGLGGRFDVRA